MGGRSPCGTLGGVNRAGVVRRTAAVAVAALTVLALTGCVRMGIDLELRPDDVARPTIILAVEDQVLDTTGLSAPDFIDQLVEDQDPAENAVRVEEYSSDGHTGERYVYDEQPISTIASTVRQPVNVVHEGDDYVVSGVLDLSRSGLGLPHGVSLDDLSVTISITFPGQVAESNGSIDGNTVHWEPPLGDDYEIRARGSAVDPASPETSPPPVTAQDPGGSTSGVPEWLVLVICLGGLVILLLLAVVVWQALRVRARDTAPLPDRHPGPYPPSPPGPHQPPSIPPRP